MKPSESTVHVSILNWNNWQSTIKCLESVFALDQQNLRVYVVDNDSKNDSVQQIQKHYPNVEIIRSDENLGYAGGHRLLLDHILPHADEADLLWILNNDVEVNPATLSELLKAYKQMGKNHIYGSLPITNDGKVHAFGPPILNEDNTFKWNEMYVLTGQVLEAGSPHLEPRQVALLHGASLLIPLQVVRRYGFMDESFFLYGEEGDYCLRLLDQGVSSVIVPRSQISHSGGGSFESSHDLRYIQTYYRHRGSLRFMLMHRGWSFTRNYLKPCFSKCLRMLLFSRYYRSYSPEEYFACLGYRDALLNRMGKTIDPGSHWTEANNC